MRGSEGCSYILRTPRSEPRARRTARAPSAIAAFSLAFRCPPVRLARPGKNPPSCPKVLVAVAVVVVVVVAAFVVV
eukprot:9279513-Pyramimonas_sp.AAC.1